MVNLGLTKVDDALAAKHPVRFCFDIFFHFCSLLVSGGYWQSKAAVHIETFVMSCEIA